MYRLINADTSLREENREEQHLKEKMPERDEMIELHKIMSNAPCADEKYALYAKLHQIEKQRN